MVSESLRPYPSEEHKGWGAVQVLWHLGSAIDLKWNGTGFSGMRIKLTFLGRSLAI